MKVVFHMVTFSLHSTIGNVVVGIGVGSDVSVTSNLSEHLSPSVGIETSMHF